MNTDTHTHILAGKPIENSVIGHTKQLDLLGTKEPKPKNNLTTNSPKYCNHSRIQFWQHELNSADYTIAASTVLEPYIWFLPIKPKFACSNRYDKILSSSCFQVIYTHRVCALYSTVWWWAKRVYVFFNAEKSS